MYARMCVEVDLNTPLLPSYSVDGNQLKIEYEGLHLICFSCGKFGHAQDLCPLKRGQEVQKKDQVKEAAKTQTMAGKEGRPELGETGIYGGWMVVQDTRKGRRQPAKDSKRADVTGRVGKEGKKIGSSRFAALEVEEVNFGTDGIGTEKRNPLQEISNVFITKEAKKKVLVKSQNVAGGNGEGGVFLNHGQEGEKKGDKSKTRQKVEVKGVERGQGVEKSKEKKVGEGTSDEVAENKERKKEMYMGSGKNVQVEQEVLGEKEKLQEKSKKGRQIVQANGPHEKPTLGPKAQVQIMPHKSPVDV